MEAETLAPPSTRRAAPMPNRGDMVVPPPLFSAGAPSLPVPPERFVALTAHEMQVPITTIVWNVDRLGRVLGDVATEERVSKVLRRLKEANLRLVTLVEDLLNLTKLQAGAFLVVRRPTQMTEIVRKATQSMEGEALRRDVHLVSSADPRKIPLTLGDPQRLAQVVRNLLSNGIKYTPQGGTVRVTLRYTKELAPPTVLAARPGTPAPGGYVLCTVEDTGIGIPRDEQSHVFEQFFRGQKAVASSQGGTGLGLFLVRTIIEQHEGTIWFSSQEGVGTTFYFTIPVVNPYAGETATGSRR